MALNKLSKYVKSSLVAICFVSGLVGLESRLYAEIYVPRDYATIQAAIDAVEDGDTVLVAAGMYDVNAPITFKGKNIILKSEEGAEKTIIDGNYQTRIFIFNLGETNEAVLEGFTITGGKSYEGGSIYCERSSPIIINNIITLNQARAGGGITCMNASPQIIDNMISNNSAGRAGGGIYCDNSQPIIQGNIISGNSVGDEWGGGIVCLNDTIAEIKNNVIIDNFAYEIGGGICLWGAEATIKNNLIVKNRTIEHGGGIAGIYSILNVMNNTIVNNTTEYMGGGIHFVHEEGYGYNGFLTVLNNIVWNNKGESELSIGGPFIVAYNDISQSDFCSQNGNICADPLLVNPNPDSNTLDNLIETGNYEGAMKYLRKCYSLQQDSPCIDAGDGYSDPDDTRSDIGAIYFDQRTCRADLYYDGFINFLDYAKFANSWMRTYPGLEGDIYIDNKVDYKDLEILAENWLYGCD